MLKPLTGEGQSDNPMLAALRDFQLWIARRRCMVKDYKTGRLVALVPKPAQHRVIDQMVAMAKAGLPIRIIILKARKEGVSTIIQAFLRFLAKTRPHWSSLAVAHTDKATQDIFELARRIHDHDPDQSPTERTTSTREIRFAHDSRFCVQTGGGHYAASGATENALHLSELAKWQGTPQVVQDQLLSLFNSVPESPESVIIIECTANVSDTSGEFKNRWEAAWRGGSVYQPVFCPWFIDPNYKLAGHRIEVSKDPAVLATDKIYEQTLVERFKLTEEQLNWRRNKIRGDFNGDIVMFMQEYPATPEEAFQYARGRIFKELAIETHDLSVPREKWGEWDAHGGLDWGGRNPFVFLLVLHQPGKKRFSIDTDHCPNTWRELTAWSRDDKGCPLNANKHVADALRYAVMQYNLCGHVHVAREIYEPDSAALGRSPLDDATIVKQVIRGVRVMGIAADRSEPKTINAFAQQGLPVCGYRRPGTTDVGEIEQGIKHLQNLMGGSIEYLRPEPPEPTIEELIEELRRKRKRYRIGEASTEMVLKLRERQRRNMQHPWLAGCH